MSRKVITYDDLIKNDIPRTIINAARESAEQPKPLTLPRKAISHKENN